jgi:hypothetical protein
MVQSSWFKRKLSSTLVEPRGRQRGLQFLRAPLDDIPEDKINHHYSGPSILEEVGTWQVGALLGWRTTLGSTQGLRG